MLAVMLAGSALIPATALAGTKVLLHTWGSTVLYKPRSFRISGDSTLFAQKLHWTSWGGATAKGHGLAAFNNCTPDCAAGHFDHYSARVVLSHRSYCSRFHRDVYLTTTLTVTGRHFPKDYARRDVLKSSCTGEPTLT